MPEGRSFVDTPPLPGGFQEDRLSLAPLSTNRRFNPEASRSLSGIPATNSFATAIQPESEESLTNSFLDMLLLPEIAFFDRSVRGVLYAVSKGEGIEGVFKRFLKGSPFAHLSDFLFNTDFSENVTSEKLLRAFGVDYPGFASQLFYDIVASPSTYIGFGALSKIGKAAKTGALFRASTGIDDLAGSVKYLMKAAEGAKRVKLGTLAEQAAEGFRHGLRFEVPWTQIGFDLTPRSFNIPIFNALDTAFAGIRRSKVGQAVSGAFSNAPIIGRQFGQNATESPIDSVFRKTTSEEINLTTAAKEVATSEAHVVTGTTNYLMEQGQKLNDIYSALDPEIQRVSSHMLEIGYRGLNEALDPTSIAQRAAEHASKVLGVGPESGFVSSLAAVGRGDLKNVTGLVKQEFASATAGVGLVGLDDALKRVGFLTQSVDAESITQLSNLKKTIAGLSPEAQAALSGHAATFFEGVKSAEIKALVEDGVIDEFVGREILDWAKNYRGSDKLRLNIAEVDRFANLPSGILEAIVHGARGVVNAQERVVALTKARFDVVDAIAKHGQTALDPKLRAKYRKSAERVVRATTDAGGNPLPGLELAAATGSALQRAAQSSTQEDLIHSFLYAYDNAMRVLQEDEKAAGVISNLYENYFAHVSTKEGKNFINSLASKAFAGSKFAGAQFQKEREFVGFTVAEVSALAREFGFKATQDIVTSKDLGVAQLTSFLRERFAKADPNFMDKLAKLDPDAHAFFHADAMQSLISRFSASGSARGLAYMKGTMAKSIDDGGIAVKAFTAADDTEIDGVAKNIREFFIKGGKVDQNALEKFVVVPTGQLFNGEAIRPSEFLADSERMAIQHMFPDMVSEADRRILAQGGSLGEEALRKIEIAEDLKNYETAFMQGRGVTPLDPFAQNIRVGETYSIMHREMFNELLDTHTKMMSPAYMGQVFRFINRATTWFKGWWTLPFPGFHARNMLGDLYMASMSGTRDPRRVSDALTMLSAAAGRGDKRLADIAFTAVSGEAVQASDIIANAWKHGVMDSRALALDMYDAAVIGGVRLKDPKASSIWSLLRGPGKNPILDKPAEIAASTQNAIRLAVFQDQVLKGADWAQAARHTKKYLVDYDHHLLAHGERTVGRTVIPYYTFTRRMIPLALEQILENPKALTIQGKFASAIAENSGASELPEELVPDYVEDMYGIPTRINDEGQPEYLLFKSWLPQGDLPEVAEAARSIIYGDKKDMNRLVRSVTARLTPFLKTPIEFATNTSFFTGKAIERFEGQESEVFGMSFSADTAYFMRQIRLLNELDKLNITGAERTGKFGQRNEISAVRRWVGFTTGVKEYGADLESERRGSLHDIERETSTLKGELTRLRRSPNAPDRQEQRAALVEQIRELKRDKVKIGLAFGRFRNEHPQSQ